MISQLRGILLQKSPPEILLDINGIGYELTVPMSTYYRLPELNQQVQLLTHLSIREDAHQLYGFFTAAERKLFRSLIKVNGVGPKLGLAVLSSIEVEDFVKTILNNDTSTLVKLPGIGKKTAERLVIEMRDRLSDWHDITPDFQPQQAMMNIQGGNVQEAIHALVALGYKPQEASRAVTRTALGADIGSELIIRAALKLLATA